MTQTLTTETVKLWRNNAEITAGETAEHDPEHIAAKAILALTAELLANREAQPVAGGSLECEDELNAALRLHRLKVEGHSQLSDSFRAGFKYARRTAPPATAVPDEKAITPCFDTLALDTAKMVMCDVNRRSDFLGGDIQLLARIQCRVDDACRAAMLAQPVSQGYKLNSPEIPDGWKLVPIDATRAMIDAAQRVEEYGYDAMHKAMLAAAPEGGNEN